MRFPMPINRETCGLVYVIEGRLHLDAGGLHEVLETGDCVFIESPHAAGVERGRQAAMPGACGSPRQEWQVDRLRTWKIIFRIRRLHIAGCRLSLYDGLGYRVSRDPMVLSAPLSNRRIRGGMIEGTRRAVSL